MIKAILLLKLTHESIPADYPHESQKKREILRPISECSFRAMKQKTTRSTLPSEEMYEASG